MADRALEKNPLAGNVPIFVDRVDTAMKRRNLLACGLATPLLLGCGIAPFFYLEWNEEVELLDGSTLTVALRYKYQRLGTALNFNRYTPSILRETTLSFSSDSPKASFSKVFPRHRVNAIHRIGGFWYLILEQRGGTAIIETTQGPQELLGPAGDGNGHKCFRLEADQLVAVPIDFFSDAQLTPNILMDYADADSLSKYNGTTLTLKQKEAYRSEHPYDVNELRVKSIYDSIINQKKRGE